MVSSQNYTFHTKYAIFSLKKTFDFQKRDYYLVI